MDIIISGWLKYTAIKYSMTDRFGCVIWEYLKKLIIIHKALKLELKAQKEELAKRNFWPNKFQRKEKIVHVSTCSKYLSEIYMYVTSIDQLQTVTLAKKTGPRTICNSRLCIFALSGTCGEHFKHEIWSGGPFIVYILKTVPLQTAFHIKNGPFGYKQSGRLRTGI